MRGTGPLSHFSSAGALLSPMPLVALWAQEREEELLHLGAERGATCLGPSGALVRDPGRLCFGWARPLVKLLTALPL